MMGLYCGGKITQINMENEDPKVKSKTIDYLQV
jgi:hypothetical protein